MLDNSNYEKTFLVDGNARTLQPSKERQGKQHQNKESEIAFRLYLENSMKTNIITQSPNKWTSANYEQVAVAS